VSFDTWSNSSLTTVQICGHKFYLRYIKRDRRPSGFKGKRGTAVHKVALEAHKRQMVDLDRWTGTEPLMKESPGSVRAGEEARDIAADAFEAAMKEGGYVSAEDKAEGVATVRAEQKDAAIDLSELYVNEIAPPIRPAAVERKISVKPKDSRITVQGYIDLVQDEPSATEHDQPTGESSDVIRDLKSAEKSPPEYAAKVSQQLTMYHLIRLAEVGKMPRAGRLVHLVRTPKKHDLKVVTQETTRDHDDISILVRRINKAVEAVDKGVFIPADPSAPGSPCGWCEYNDGTCEYVRRRP